MQPFVNSVVKNCLASRRLDVAVVLALEIGGVGRSRRLVVRLLRLVLYCCHSGPFYILLNSPPGNLFSGAINVRHKDRIVGKGPRPVRKSLEQCHWVVKMLRWRRRRVLLPLSKIAMPGDHPDAIYGVRTIARAMPLGRENVEMEKATCASAPFENSNAGGPS